MSVSLLKSAARPRSPRRDRTPPSPYGAAFQEAIKDGSLESARVVVPHLMDVARPASVADVGCGSGAWLSVFHEHGVDDVLGIDGDYVPRSSLLIPPSLFAPVDLSRPFSLERTFDLAMSVEVAEHLPARSAAAFVASLTALSDVVAFSAAIPNQGGEGHVNEQWPSYWKPLFEARGFVLVDCLRRRVWNDRRVEKWYRQNLLLYVRRERLKADARLRAEYEANKNQILDVVLPEMFYPLSLPQLVKSFPASVKRAVVRRL